MKEKAGEPLFFIGFLICSDSTACNFIVFFSFWRQRFAPNCPRREFPPSRFVNLWKQIHAKSNLHVFSVCACARVCNYAILVYICLVGRYCFKCVCVFVLPCLCACIFFPGRRHEVRQIGPARRMDGEQAAQRWKMRNGACRLAVPQASNAEGRLVLIARCALLVSGSPLVVCSFCLMLAGIVGGVAP